MNRSFHFTKPAVASLAPDCLNSVWMRWVAAAGLYVALFASAVPAHANDMGELKLRAVLSGSGAEVGPYLDWFVEWDGAWLGPLNSTTLQAGQGGYSAEVEVLGGERLRTETTVTAGKSSELFLEIDATLVEIALSGVKERTNVSLEYRASYSMGSTGLRSTDDGVVYALVAKDTNELVLTHNGTRHMINADVASGNHVRVVAD